jgi:hypothetical protein
MPSLVELKAGESTVLIAVTGEPDVAAVGSIDDRIETVQAALRDKFQVVAQISKDFADALQTGRIPVKSAEVEFGLGATGKGTVYVVETSVNATFKIKLSLDLSVK